MSKELRPYQKKSVQEAFKELSNSTDPVLFVMSVGGGKSICSAAICKRMQDLNKHVLCLVNSAELVRNNSLAFIELGGKSSVFCASLNEKDDSSSVIFATPQSIMAALKRGDAISKRIFNLIIVDEAHQIGYKNHRSCFMRILRHYKQAYNAMRLLGLTGTPYRLENGETESIVGEQALFKKTVANITTQWLIEHDYLATPEFGTTVSKNIDTSAYDESKTAKKRQEALTNIGKNNHRLTWDILQEVQEIMKNRNGAFVFCSSIQHCYEAMAALPENLSRIITGATPDEERKKILTSARNKEIKYLISVSCLLVGIDVPYFCTSVFLRPTSSLTLFMQAIGRSLRLHPEKRNALVLDYAQNLDRFQDFDDPIINEAIQPKEEDEDPDYCITCYQCNTLNKATVRRCRGIHNNSRCDYYFKFKPCTNEECDAENDITARQCRICGEELIDPNKKLKDNLSLLTYEVENAKYWVTKGSNDFFPVIHVKYTLKNNTYIYERFFTKSDKSKKYTYSKFLKPHIENRSKYYPMMSNYHGMKNMIETEIIMTPTKLTCRKDDFGKLVITRKLFD